MLSRACNKLWNSYLRAVTNASDELRPPLLTEKHSERGVEHLTLLDHLTASLIDNETYESHPSRDDDRPTQ